MKVVLLLVFLMASCRPSNQISELVGVINERPVEGTKWLLVELNGRAISTVDFRAPVSVVYKKETNTVSGFAGCNSFTGSYKMDGSTISSTLASTHMFCQETMEMETAFLAVLQMANNYKMEERHLVFKDKGKVVARFLAEVKPTD